MSIDIKFYLITYLWSCLLEWLQNAAVKRYSYAEYSTVSVGMQMISGQVFSTVLIERMITKSAVLVEATLAVAALKLATSSWN